MKKRFSILIVDTVIVGLTLSFFGAALTSQTASAEKDQNSYRQAPKPVHATDVKVVKKVFLSEDDVRGIRGKPTSPPGQDKKNGSKEEYTATGILGKPLAEGASKYAIVIGICDYPGEDYDICLSDGDSYNMYQTLTGLYGYDPANIYWYRDMGNDPNNYGIDGAPTWSNISNAVIEIKSKATNIDEVVFFFSGHGGWADDISGDEADGRDEAIWVHNGIDKLVPILDDELVDWFFGFETSRIAFVFDTCLAGGMNDVASDGRVIVMSSGETQSSYVYSNGELGEGVFSRLFVNKGMLQGLADRYNQIEAIDNNVAIEEAFNYAKKNIPGWLKRKQKPVISDNFTDDLLL